MLLDYWQKFTPNLDFQTQVCTIVRLFLKTDS